MKVGIGFYVVEVVTILIGPLAAIVDFLVKERLKDEDGAVLQLTEDNFDNILKVTPLVLVEFFADWCPPCQALEPLFYGAAKR